jgi:hypothetical protein
MKFGLRLSLYQFQNHPPTTTAKTNSAKKARIFIALVFFGACFFFPDCFTDFFLEVIS